MAVSVNDVVAQMRAALSLSDPDLDSTVGSPIRKILDAVGEVVAEAYVDQYMMGYQYDIDSKTGEDLDEFILLFGFTRFPAKRATGTVTFERTSMATADTLIPVGTQLATDGSSPVVVQTTVPALLLQGQTSVQVPVQALIGGAAGNIPANALTVRMTAFEGVNSFSNTTALTGGADEESDSQVRDRFKKTVFRNMAGTEQMFLATALNDDAVSQANVIGAAKTYREQIQIIDGTATSTITDARYIYPDSQTFGANIDAGDILTPNVHYSFDTATPPTITILDSATAPDGVYDLEFEFVPESSRNDPTNGVTNRVDVYVNGNRATEAVEMVTFHSSRTFNTTANDPLNIANFARVDASEPEAGNYFIAFAFGPVTDPSTSNTITINGINYVEGTDFFLVNDITREGGTPTSMSGIELVSTANGAALAIPADATTFQVDYVFNAVPRDVEAQVRTWRLITTDAKVHQAKTILLNIYLAVIYSQGYNEAAVRPSLESALSNYIGGVGFNGTVQVSDILEVAHQVTGVDAVRFLTDSDDATNFAIQQVSGAGTVLQTYATSVPGQVRRALDVRVGDDSTPVFNSLGLLTRAANTFGAV